MAIVEELEAVEEGGAALRILRPSGGILRQLGLSREFLLGFPVLAFMAIFFVYPALSILAQSVTNVPTGSGPRRSPRFSTPGRPMRCN
jgi:hypothetical protein